MISMKLIGPLAALIALSPLAAAPALAIPHATTPLTEQTKNSLLQSGTLIRISLDQTLSSAHNKVGDKFGFTVVDDVKVGDRVVIPAGTKGTGAVAAVRPAHGGGGDGMLRVTLDPVPVPSGVPVSIGITQDSVIADSNQKNGAGGVITDVADITVPGFVLFDMLRKGSDVTLRAGAPFHIAVTEDAFFDPPAQ
ncbi:MAG TPA: hypothetical protein VII69_02420 [Candidatus Eremiobacteraceae bacterium]